MASSTNGFRTTTQGAPKFSNGSASASCASPTRKSRTISIPYWRGFGLSCGCLSTKACVPSPPAPLPTGEGCAAHEIAPFDPLPNHEARQPQGQLADPFGEGNGQRNVRRQSEQRPKHNKAALEGAQRSGHQERRRIDAGAEAFEHKGVGHAEMPAQEMHDQPDLARAGGPSGEAQQAGAKD